MEENEQENQGPSFFDITISASVESTLGQACRWALAFVYISGGAIMLGLVAIMVKWDEFDRRMYTSSSLEYILLAVIAVWVLLFIGFLLLLFNFAIKVKKGLRVHDMAAIERGISSVKLYFILSGISGIVYIVLFLLNFLNFHLTI